MFTVPRLLIASITLWGAATHSALAYNAGPFGTLPQQEAPAPVIEKLAGCDTPEQKQQCFLRLYLPKDGATIEDERLRHFALTVLLRSMAQDKNELDNAHFQWRTQAGVALTQYQDETGTFISSEREAIAWLAALLSEAYLTTSYGQEKSNVLESSMSGYENFFSEQDDASAVQEYWAQILADHNTAQANLESEQDGRKIKRDEAQHWRTIQCQLAEANGAWERALDCRLLAMPTDSGLTEWKRSNIDFALTHKLNTRAIALLTSPAQLSTGGNDNPFSPDITRYQAYVKEACALAKKPTETFLCDYGKFEAARATQNYDAAVSAAEALLPSLNKVDILQTVFPLIDMLGLFENLALLAYQSGDYTSASQIFDALANTETQVHGRPTNRTRYNLFLSRYQNGEDLTTDPYFISALAEGSDLTRLHVIAAACHYRENRLADTLRALETIKGERFKGVNGFAASRILLINALHGEHQYFQRHWQAESTYDTEFALSQSHQALLQLAESPNQNGTLELQGSLFPLTPSSGFFVSFTDADTLASTHLVFQHDKQHAAALVLDPGVDPNNRYSFFAPTFDLSSDGQWFVVCEEDEYCYLRNADNGRLIRRWSVGNIRTARIIQNRFLATLTHLGKLDLWALDTGQRYRTLSINSHARVSFTTLNNSNRLLISGEQLQLWDYQENRILFTRTADMFHAHTKFNNPIITHMEQHPTNGKVLVSLISYPPTDTQTYRPTPLSELHTDFVWWDLNTDTLSSAAKGKQGKWSAAFAANGKPYLLGQISDDTDTLRYAASLTARDRDCDEQCQREANLPSLPAPPQAGHSPNSGIQIAYARYQHAANRGVFFFNDRTTAVYDYNEKQWLGSQRQSASRLSSPAYNNTSNTLALLADHPENDYISLWSLQTGQETHRIAEPYGNGLVALGEHFLTWDNDTIRIYDAITGTRNSEHDIPDWQPDDKVFPNIENITVLQDQRLFLFEENYEDGNYDYRIRETDTALNDIAFTGWQLTTERGLDRNQHPIIFPNSRRLFRINGAHLVEESLEKSESLQQWAISDFAIENPQALHSLGDNHLALRGRDTLAVLNINTGEHWHQTLADGEWQSVAFAQGSILAVARFSAFSRVLTLNTADGSITHATVYPEALASLSMLAPELNIGLSTLGEFTLWQPQSDAPQIRASSLTDGNWVALNRQGLFDSNAPGDLEALSWVLPDAPRTPLPLQAFMKEFYEPGLLPKTLRGDVRQHTSLTQLDRSMPHVHIENVRDNGDGTAAVTVRVQPGQSGEAHDLRLFREGQLVGWLPEKGNGIFQDSTREKRYTFDAIPLAPQSQSDNRDNEHTALTQFSAYAFNQDGIRSERDTQALHTSSAPVSAPSRAFVISIGVNRYENSAFDLRYAANDAHAYQQQLANALGQDSQFEQVVRIPLVSEHRNGSPADEQFDATRAQLHAVLDALAGNGTHPLVPFPATISDRIILTFSGHGYASDDGRFHFLLEDIGSGSTREVTPALLNHTFTSDDLADRLRPIPSQHIALIIDACNSAASINQAGFIPGPMGSRGLGQLAYDKGMVVLAASQGDDVAIESRSLQHGLLTYALVKEGMAQQRADFAPQDGQLWLNEWLQYGQQRVPQLHAALLEGEPLALQEGDRGFAAAATEDNQAAAKPAKAQQPSVFDFSRQSGWALPLSASHP